MDQKIRQMGTLFRVDKSNRATYYSVTEKKWKTKQLTISLADICGLNHAERDRVLDWFRFRMWEKETTNRADDTNPDRRLAQADLAGAGETKKARRRLVAGGGRE